MFNIQRMSLILNRRLLVLSVVVATFALTSPHVRAAGPGTIATVAGNGTAGFSGDGGPATSAELNGPGVVMLDAGEHVYITDYLNDRVRELNDGVITTIAGNGVRGEAGDGGSATSAQLALPGDVLFDGSGALYIADSSPYCRVRKVIGTIITTAVSLCGVRGSPSDITMHDGDLYISDWVNCYVWKAAGPAFSELSAIAGTGTCGYNGDGIPATSAQLFHPDGIRFDVYGNLYIADSINCRVREVSGGTITTFAGTGTCAYGGDGGPANLALLHQPESLAFDVRENLYVADTLNCRIREIAGGTIKTVIGNGTCGYSGDGGAATSAQINGPSGLAFDTAGDAYFADFTNNVVRVVYALAPPPPSVGGIAEIPSVAGPSPSHVYLTMTITILVGICLGASATGIAMALSYVRRSTRSPLR